MTITKHCDTCNAPYKADSDGDDEGGAYPELCPKCASKQLEEDFKDVPKERSRDKRITQTLKLECEKCKKKFTFSYSYSGMEPCMQGLIPKYCEECGDSR